MTYPQRSRLGFSYCPIICCVLALCTAVAPASDALSPLKIDQVKVGGEIGRRIDMTVQNNLNKLDLEGDFIKPFRKKDRNGGFIGVGGKATYFKVPNPGLKTLVDDELTK